VDDGNENYDNSTLDYVPIENPIDLEHSHLFIRAKENLAIGLRLENSGWVFGGYDFNMDILIFQNTKEAGLFLTPGGQVGIGGGKGWTAGILYGENLPNRESYAGPSLVEGGLSIPLIIFPVNIETDRTRFLSANSDGTVPIISYYGLGPLDVEAGLYQEPAYTLDIVNLLKEIISWLSGN
jgi:hypothetical protein